MVPGNILELGVSLQQRVGGQVMHRKGVVTWSDMSSRLAGYVVAGCCCVVADSVSEPVCGGFSLSFRTTDHLELPKTSLTCRWAEAVNQ